MDIKKLSIIIPCYNEKNTIEKIVDKILDVDLGKIGKEIIIIDDASTDETVQVLKTKLNYFNRAYFNAYIVDTRLILAGKQKGKAKCISQHLTK